MCVFCAVKRVFLPAFLLAEDVFYTGSFAKVENALPVVRALSERHQLHFAVCIRNTVLEMHQIHAVFESFQNLLRCDLCAKCAEYAEGQLHVRRHQLHQPLIHRNTADFPKIRRNGMKFLKRL